MNILNLFKKKQPPSAPTIYRVYEQTAALYEQLDDVLFMLGRVNIKHDVFSGQTADFAKKSEFAVSSLRNTLKLAAEAERAQEKGKKK